MAKHSFPPLLWLILALVVRADLIAIGQTRTPKPSLASAAPLQPIADSKTNYRASRAPANQSARPAKTSPSVDYAISGDIYQAEAGADNSSERTQLRAPQRHATLSRVSGVRRNGTPLQSKPANDQVQYDEERFGEIESGEEEIVAGEYGAEMYEDEYLGADGYDGYETFERGGLFHWMHGPWFRTSHNSPPNIGLGEPLQGTSWLNRPSSISFFAGVLNGDELIANRVDQGSALFGGFRLGWDFDHYWGLEARAGWSSPAIEYEPAPPPKRVDGIFLADVSVLYYPWGDSAWRPYGLIGMGIAGFDFTDEVGDVHNPFLLGIPIGFGLKYQYHPNLAFRAEFLNNIACAGSELDGMSNLSFSLGMELRFGGKPRSYYPWQPAKYIW